MRRPTCSSTFLSSALYQSFLSFSYLIHLISTCKHNIKQRIDQSKRSIEYKWMESDTFHTYKHYKTIQTYGRKVQILYWIEEGITTIVSDSNSFLQLGSHPHHIKSKTSLWHHTIFSKVKSHSNIISLQFNIVQPLIT